MMGPPEVLAAPIVADRALFLRQAAAKAPTVCWVECGVARGVSARVLASCLPNGGQLHAFDSFDGLPRDWDLGDITVPRGKFRCHIPTFDDHRVYVHRGLFHDTLPSWNPCVPIGLLHVDCDIYESARTVFSTLGPSLAPGAVIICDEVFGYPAWAQDEYRALAESGLSVAWFLRGEKWRAAATLIGDKHG